VWFIMSSDFQCPYCQQFHATVWPRIEKEYVATGKVRVAFLNHPMSFHDLAKPAAEAAMCAGKQDKFWQMHDGIFHTQDKWAKGGRPQVVFDSLATSLGLRMEDWRACVTSRATLEMVEADFARSSAGGVKGTPSFFVDDQLAIVGLDSYENFKAALDAAIARAR
jgi:protein-disulfide isomerase